MPRDFDHLKITQATPTGNCWCGCGGQTEEARFFLRGHDAKALGYLYTLHLRGPFINDGLANLLLSLGYDDATKTLWGAMQREHPE